MRGALPVFILCLALAKPAWAVDRVVGVSAPAGGVTLVKRVYIPAGIEVRGIEIVTNDLSTVFPAVRLRHLGDRSGIRGDIVCEASTVAPGVDDPHRFVAALPRTLFNQGTDLLIEVVLPPTSGVDVIGQGAGLGALELGGAPATSYIGYEATGELQALDADLCLALVGSSRVGKAGSGEPASRTPESRGFDLRIEAPIGAPPQVYLAIPTPMAVEVDILDVRGRRVRVLAQGVVEPGERRLVWDRRDLSGNPVAAGIYFVVARAGATELRRKLTLLR